MKHLILSAWLCALGSFSQGDAGLTIGRLGLTIRSQTLDDPALSFVKLKVRLERSRPTAI
jgi:hypothetical protein